MSCGGPRRSLLMSQGSYVLFLVPYVAVASGPSNFGTGEALPCSGSPIYG